MPAAKKSLKAANRSGNSVTGRFQKGRVGPQVQHQQDSSAEEGDLRSADGSDGSEYGVMNLRRRKWIGKKLIGT
jgi:hypothetical protein